MPDDLETTIRDNAQGPAKASGDSGSMEQHPLPDQIAADRYLESKKAVRRKGLGRHGRPTGKAPNSADGT
jgi:hypothetical protein